MEHPLIEKTYITPQQLLDDSIKLGLKILESGFEPKFIVAIWRGGTPVGIAVQELLDHFGIKADHIAIRTSAYKEINRRCEDIHVHGLGYIVEHTDFDDSLLIVDDVYDSGLSVKAVLDNLTERSRRNTPKDIRIATVYYKPTKNRTDRVPDYYIHETDKWLVFPHEMKGLTYEEICRNKPQIWEFIKGVEKQ